MIAPRPDQPSSASCPSVNGAVAKRWVRSGITDDFSGFRLPE
ncbi:Uncharacterised protein [Mycobacteroides abscessus subsp. abscessus]|nr:Uncharacterised protein [Mycobacteroides abscessus subsp. abscessus]